MKCFVLWINSQGFFFGKDRNKMNRNRIKQELKLLCVVIFTLFTCLCLIVYSCCCISVLVFGDLVCGADWLFDLFFSLTQNSTPLLMSSALCPRFPGAFYYSYFFLWVQSCQYSSSFWRVGALIHTWEWTKRWLPRCGTRPPPPSTAWGLLERRCTLQ